MGLVSAAALFGAGGSQAAPSGAPASKDIEVWMINNPNAPIIKAFDDAGKNFEAAAGIKVNYVRTPTNDFHTKLVTSISAKVYPDMVIWNSSAGLEFANTGMVELADDIMNSVGRENYSNGAIETFFMGGKLYALPFLIRPSGVHARKSWLQKAGYDTTLRTDAQGNFYYEGLITWEDILEAGKKITDVSNGKYGLGFAYTRKAFGDSAGFTLSVLTAYGSKIIDTQGNVIIDSPETKAGIDFLRKFWQSGAVPPAATTWDGNSNNQFFINGDIGIVNNSNSILPALTDTTPVKKEDVIIIPAPAGPKGRIVIGTPESITIFKTDKLAYSREYAKYLMNPETQITMFKTMGFGYYSPLRQDVLKSSLFMNLSDNERVMAADSTKTVHMTYPAEPNAGVQAAYSTFIYDDALARIAIDNWNSDQIAAEMEKRFKEALE
jgi:multiple sugar transport system substrate-binding protein